MIVEKEFVKDGSSYERIQSYKRILESLIDRAFESPHDVTLKIDMESVTGKLESLIKEYKDANRNVETQRAAGGKELRNGEESIEREQQQAHILRFPSPNSLHRTQASSKALGNPTV